MAVEAKICGLTRPDDARAAAAAGAAYLGVVLANSPRQVGARAAGEIVAAAGKVPVIGVFGGIDAAEALELCARAGLSGVQLHGAHSAADARELRSHGLIVWRVVRIGEWADLAAVERSAESADAVLVEPFVAHAAGGSGTGLALDLACAARERLAGHRMVLAGGLRPETVGSVTALVRPDVVDVSSGVEVRPGVKHAARISRFMEALLECSPAR